MKRWIMRRRNQGKHNGLYGNLQVMVSVEKNDDFERVGQDLYHNLVLDFATATLGGEVEVPTLDGKTKIKIEPGTQPGKQIRLRGKGMPAIKGYGYGRGDIIVNITVFIPTSLTKEEKLLQAAIPQVATPQASRPAEQAALAMVTQETD